MKRFLFIAILIFGCCSPAIMAQKFAAAYLDMQYILKNLPQYEIANAFTCFAACRAQVKPLWRQSLPAC